MTIILIEGPDLSGKTFAIEKISKHFNSGLVLKNAYKPKTINDSKKLYEHYWSIINMVIDREDICILDRLYPSQAVYSYLRGVDEMEGGEIVAFDHYADTMNFLYVYIDTEREILEHRYDERGDEHVTKDMLFKLKDRYDRFYDWTDMTKIKVNTLEPDWLEKLTKWINANR